MLDKLVITNGALFDYEEIVCHTEMDKKLFREDVEKLLKSEKTRIEYKDCKTGKNLILFLRRGYDFGIMRCWILEGICEKCDYSEEMEVNGIIKEWLAIEIED